MWILEPEYLIVIGGGALLVLLGLLIMTGRGFLLYWMGLTVMLVGAGWLVGWLIETDVERIEKVIYAIETAAKENDNEEILSHISETNLELRLLVTGFKWVHIDDAKVTALHRIDVTRKNSNKTAEAELNFYVQGSYSTEGFKSRKIPMRAILGFAEEEEDVWRIISYRDVPVIQKAGQ